MALPATQPLRPSSHRLPAPSQETSISTKPCQRFGRVSGPVVAKYAHTTLTGAPMGGSPACLPSAGGELVLLSGQVGSSRIEQPGPLPRCQLVIFYPMLMMPRKKQNFLQTCAGLQGNSQGSFMPTTHPPAPPPATGRALSPSHDWPDPAVLGGGGAGGQEKRDQRKEKGRLPLGEPRDTSQGHTRRRAPAFLARVHLEPQGKFWAISVPPGGGCRSRMSWGGRGQEKKECHGSAS